MINASRIVVLGGSICRILRGLDAPGGPAFNQAVRPGGSAKEPCSRAEDRGWELGEAGSDECMEDCGSRGLHLVYSTRFGGPGRSNL